MIVNLDVAPHPRVGPSAGRAKWPVPRLFLLRRGTPGTQMSDLAPAGVLEGKGGGWYAPCKDVSRQKEGSAR